ncbi:MAG: alkaline phosphatase [Sphingobacteriia bacterium]|nr:alkaline phosphatase [Sphingobacteriia bacterium]
MNFDLIVFCLFLIINLFIGLILSKGIKNIKEYALGSRNFSTSTLAATIVATWIGGSSFALTALETYRQGYYFAIPGIADGISFFIIAYLYAPRMREFLGNLSVAEAMGNLWGPLVRLITAISAIIPAIGNVAIQFSILTVLLNYLLGISSSYAMIISSLIIIIYSTFGGIKAVTFTDMIQFFTFGVVIPMTAYLIWKSFSNFEAIETVFTQNPLFDYKQVFDHNNPKFLNTIFLFLFFLIPGLDPAIFQRISMAKNTIQVTKSFSISGIIITFWMYGILYLVGVLLLANGVEDLNPDNVVKHILDNYVHTGLKGIFVVGIMAMVMSTADSYINCSAVLFANDILKALGIKLEEKRELLFVRISALIIGVGALLISLFSKGILDMILGTYSFFMPIVSVPLILAIFGFRSSKTSVLIGMAAGFITVVLFKLFSDIDSLMPGMVANLILYFLSHFLFKQEGGWVGIKDQTSLDEIRKLRKRKINLILQSTKNFKIIKFFAIPKEDKTYVYFGLFCLVSVFSTFYTLPSDIYGHNEAVVNFLYYSILIISTSFITYPLWLKKLTNRTYISIFWNFSIFYCLIFTSSLFAIISKFNQLQLTVLMANIITAAILLRWQVAIIMIFTGIFLSLKSYTWYLKVDSINDLGSSLEFKTIYLLILLSSILIAFLKPKQDSHELSEARNEHLATQIKYRENELEKLLNLKNEFINNINHEVRTPLVGITSIGESLWENYDNLTEEQRRNATKKIASSSKRLITLMNNILDLSNLNSEKYELKFKLSNLSQILINSIEECKKLYLKDKELEFITEIEKDIELYIDEYYIKQTFDNLIINAINYSDNGRIFIKLKKIELGIKFSIEDEGIGIPKEEVIDIFEPFRVSSRTKTMAGGRGIGLALCKKVIEVHKGKIWAESNGNKGSIFIFTIPL